MTDRVAIVTGASAGIGRAVALELARKGYAVLLAARREDRLRQVAQACDAAGGRGLVAVTDVGEADQVQALVDRAASELGRLDVMVNNAGFGLLARVHETTVRQMHEIFRVNYFGVFYGCRAAAPVMIRQRGGHIFNVSSVVGRRGTPFNGAYCATKFAICGLTDCLRVEMMPHDVRVTCVCPALTETEFPDVMGDSSRTSGSRLAALPKVMKAEAVARRIVAAVGHRKPRITFTLGGKFLATLGALSPRLTDAMLKLYHDDLVKHLTPPG